VATFRGLKLPKTMTSIRTTKRLDSPQLPSRFAEYDDLA